MIHRKTSEEIAYMQEGGARLGAILTELIAFARPGIELLAIDKRADALIEKAGCTPSFKTVKGYRHATCLCPNHVVVHGVPNRYVLNDGDMLTIDVGLIYKGFHTDTAWTMIVGTDQIEEHSEKLRFLDTGKRALAHAIDVARVGNYIGDISEVVQKEIEGAGYQLVKSLVGHGVGHELHEDPQVPNYVRGVKANTYRFVGGETIAIEPIYVMGEGSIVYENDDGWSLATRDHSLAAVFEHSLAITPDGPIVLTKNSI